MAKYRVTFTYTYEYEVDAPDEYTALRVAEGYLTDPDYDGYLVENIESEETDNCN